ncbi:MFS transporter [Nonomuraea jabiensis]|uniref:EmrB/QacA subfamily drug resistance transporter n=1 Tax=Nonomuraea jabiensis TaxID=882448 RepID=A0A7W9GEP4_9ACTN|nr:MFS transporter [Nonomuraea jabiensis]MBB5782432.1 EmrB/QacA subfamily drug resistance transporter [Nonomuraea jabiensis]
MTLSTATTTERRHSPWLVLFTLCLGFFMILLDTTIVNIAIPQMSDHLKASLSDILWIINAYVLIYAVLLITAGRLGDLYGPKRLFMIGLVIFTAASAACGFAQNPAQLIVFRVIQGLGGALLTPQTLSVLTVIFPSDKRGAAFGVWGAVAGVATLAGPLLGGWLVTDFGWQWIFFVNLPVGVIALVLAGIVMPDLRLNRRPRLDWTGTVLVTAALFLITFGLIEGQSHDWGRVWGPITIVEILVAGVVVLGLFFAHQWSQQRREPLVPFQIFRDRNFSVMNVVAASIAFGMLGLFLPLTIFLQSVLELSALQAALTMAPMALISMLVAPVAGRAADRVGGKWILFAGMSLFSIGMGVLIASSQVDTSRLDLLPGLIVAGFGLGMTFAPMQTVAMRNVEPRMAGAASGLINTTRQLGGVIGSAAVGAVLQAQISTHLKSAAVADAGRLPPQYRTQVIDTLSHVASGSQDIAAGQIAPRLPAGLPDQARAQLDAFFTLVFHQGFVGAMRATLWLPIAVMGGAALAVTLVRRRSSRRAEQE